MTGIATTSNTRIRCSRARGLPFTLYVPTNYPSGRGDLWWLALEQAVDHAETEIAVARDGKTWRLPTKTVGDKESAFEELYWWLRGLDERTQRHARARSRNHKASISRHSAVR
jgi:hypothetical protein